MKRNQGHTRRALPNPDEVYVICDGEPFERFSVEGPDTIRIDHDIDSHQYHIFTDYRGSGPPRRGAALEPRATGASVAFASTPQPARGAGAGNGTSEFFPDGGPTCSCC